MLDWNTLTINSDSDVWQYKAEPSCTFTSCRASHITPCFTYKSPLKWFLSSSTTGGRRTLWRGSPAVWTPPASMRMTSWRRLSRARTFPTSATMKVWQDFRFLGIYFEQNFCVSVTSLLEFLFSSDSNLRLFVSKDGTTALSGTQLANRYTTVHISFTASVYSLSCLHLNGCVFVCLCVFSQRNTWCFWASGHWDSLRDSSSPASSTG